MILSNNTSLRMLLLNLLTKQKSITGKRFSKDFSFMSDSGDSHFNLDSLSSRTIEFVHFVRYYKHL